MDANYTWPKPVQNISIHKMHFSYHIFFMYIQEYFDSCTFTEVTFRIPPYTPWLHMTHRVVSNSGQLWKLPKTTATWSCITPSVIFIHSFLTMMMSIDSFLPQYFEQYLLRVHKHHVITWVAPPSRIYGYITEVPILWILIPKVKCIMHTQIRKKDKTLEKRELIATK